MNESDGMSNVFALCGHVVRLSTELHRPTAGRPLVIPSPRQRQDRRHKAVDGQRQCLCLFLSWTV